MSHKPDLKFSIRTDVAIEYFILKLDFNGHQFKILPRQHLEQSFALRKEFRKIYIIRNDQAYLYVGEANTDIKTRLQRGFRAFRHYIKNGKARRGYKGYKWLQEQFQIDSTISVITFKKDLMDYRGYIEAIEGELVFLIREQTGRWPLFQNEIHFSNNVGAKTLALKIFRKIGPNH